MGLRRLQNHLSEVLLSSVKPSSDIYKRYVDDANDQPWDRYDKWCKDINVETFDTELAYMNGMLVAY